MKGMIAIAATGVSAGMGVGKAWVLEKNRFEFSREPVLDISAELGRFECALDKVISDTKALLNAEDRLYSGPKADILDAYLTLLEDPETAAGVRELINSGVNAPSAVSEAVGNLVGVFEGLEDAYMRERAFDLRDIMNSLLSELLGMTCRDFSGIPPGSVLIAENISASDTARMNLDNLAGIMTVLGGKNSHVSIVARGFDIPAITGAPDMLDSVCTGDEVLLDGAEGTAYIRPTPDVRRAFFERRDALVREIKALARFSGKKAVTRDGVEAETFANVGDSAGVERAVKYTADGIGLFRSEFLFMGQSSAPDEETQLESYKYAAEAMDGKPVVIRTMDIGGDKRLDYLGLEDEENPYLGYRAVRICLDRPELFRAQLRAILRAGLYGNVSAMIPFISSVEEMRLARAAFEDAKASLEADGLSYGKNVALGAMIEIPSAAVMAKEIAAECDFFSIGTNDLIQYTIAADRGNPKVSELHTSYHPAVLRLVDYIIKAALNAGIPCCMCGEAAGDTKLIPVFFGMGLRAFSMSPGRILSAREAISSFSVPEAEALAARVLSCGTTEEVISIINPATRRSPRQE